MNAMAVEIKAKKYDSLLRRTERLHISFKKAVLFVGGEKRLEALMDEGRVRYFKPEGKSNTMWRFNLADIIKCVKPI